MSLNVTLARPYKSLLESHEVVLTKYRRPSRASDGVRAHEVDFFLCAVPSLCLLHAVPSLFANSPLV